VTDLLQRVEQNIQNRRLLQSGQPVLAAVSGGPDSMVLLRVLHGLSSRHHWKLTVAHFNHRLRGRSSDADERLVRRAAAALKLPFVAGRGDVKGLARKSKLSIEMAARQLRHEFLARAAQERKIRAVVLAHHADDQVELFFLRLLRGAGGEGLAGMKWRSPSPVDSKIRLLRPLLDATKEELRRFARENKIRFREDATNAQLEMPRNRLRNELLPLLRRRYQPALTRTVLRLMEIVGAEADWTGESARQWLVSKQQKVGRTPRPVLARKPGRADLLVGLDARQRVPTRLVFNDLPVAVQRRVLQLQLSEAGVPSDFELIESLRQSADVPVSVGTHLSVVRDAIGMIRRRPTCPAGFNANETTVKLAGRAGEVNFDGVRVCWRLDAQKTTGRPAARTAGEFFDAGKIGGQILLRHWRPGDRFQPIGLKSAVKLQDLFTNAKIPRARRRELAVAATASGEIFWVEKLRIGERFKLTPQTRRRLVWRWHHLADRPKERLGTLNFKHF